MAISKFKATCLAVLERVRRTGEPLTITKLGKPIAEIIPPRAKEVDRQSLFGKAIGTARILGDLGDLAEMDSGLDPEDSVREWQELNDTAKRRGLGSKRKARTGAP